MGSGLTVYAAGGSGVSTPRANLALYLSATNGIGVYGAGHGDYQGGMFVGGLTGDGISCSGGATSGRGLIANGGGTSGIGVVGTGGSPGGDGVSGTGVGNGNGVDGYGAGNGCGGYFFGGATGNGVYGHGFGGGYGGMFYAGATGIGIYGTGGDNPNGMGVVGQGLGTGCGGCFYGGATAGSFGVRALIGTNSVYGIYTNGRVGIGNATPHTGLAVVGLPSYATDAAAGTAGLTTGDFYILTSTRAVQVKA
jgi:hypothetical protein